MFKVTFIKIKDLIKFFLIILLLYIGLEFIIKLGILNKRININANNYIEVGINSESNIIKNITKGKERKQKKADDDENKRLKKILQIGNIEFKEKTEYIINHDSAEDNKIETNNKEKEEEVIDTKIGDISDTQSNIETQIITENPIKESYNKEYNGVKIKNETSFELTENILNDEGLNINADNVIIFHTHTCESYTESTGFEYNSTGNYRTTDLKYSVARVGDELTNYLSTYGFNVKHNTNYHDYPAYTGSYTRSLSTVKNILETFDSDIIIDLHRDAIGSRSDYAPTVKIGEEECAQIMFVMGTNGGGLTHPNWNQNLKFAVKIQEKANEIYPGLCKPIILRNSRYNQHLGKAACIIEVGATGNTLEQTINSMKYLAEIMNKALK